MITGSDLGERGFIRRVFESSVAGAFGWDRDGDRQGGREAFVAQMGERLGGDINMHGYFNALGAPNLDVSTSSSCSTMPTCPVIFFSDPGALCKGAKSRRKYVV